MNVAHDLSALAVNGPQPLPSEGGSASWRRQPILELDVLIRSDDWHVDSIPAAHKVGSEIQVADFQSALETAAKLDGDRSLSAVIQTREGETFLSTVSFPERAPGQQERVLLGGAALNDAVKAVVVGGQWYDLRNGQPFLTEVGRKVASAERPSSGASGSRSGSAAERLGVRIISAASPTSEAANRPGGGSAPAPARGSAAERLGARVISSSPLTSEAGSRPGGGSAPAPARGSAAERLGVRIISAASLTSEAGNRPSGRSAPAPAPGSAADRLGVPVISSASLTRDTAKI